MADRPTTVAQYMATLPPERKKALQALRKVMKQNLDPKLKEGIQYGMPSYFVPHSVYPDGYHCDPKQPLPFGGFASQKNHMSLYLFCMYCDPKEVAAFQKAWKATGKKLDMGKSCIRFKNIEDVPLDVVAKTVKSITAAKFIAAYEAGFGAKRKAAKKKTAKKTAKKATKKVAEKKATKKVGARKKVAKKAGTKAKATKRKATKKPAAKRSATATLGVKKRASAKKASKKVARRGVAKKKR